MFRLLVLLLLLGAGQAAAQAPPACVAGREGMVACLGEKLCECRWQSGGTLSGRPAGYRWDCGVLRPACGVVPPGPPSAPLPDLLLPFPVERHPPSRR